MDDESHQSSLGDLSLAGTVSSMGDNKETAILPVVPTDSDSMTPLMRAATLSDPSLLLQLIRQGEAVATLFVKDGKGRTALDWARLCNNHLTIIALRKAMLANIDDARIAIVRAPQDVDEKTKYANTVAHMRLTEALKQRRSDVCVDIITESREQFERDDVERVDGEVYFLDAGHHAGFTPLMLACTYNMPELVTLLLDFDVDLEQQNKYGYTALSCACAGGHADIVRLLIFTGANLHHKTNEGRTGLHLACMYLKGRVISILLDFLFERFSVYRMKHPKYGFDSTRWTRYATMMEGYMDIKDGTGKTAWELLPLPASMHAARLGTRLGAGLGPVDLLLPADSPIRRSRGEKEQQQKQEEEEEDEEEEEVGGRKEYASEEEKEGRRSRDWGQEEEQEEGDLETAVQEKRREGEKEEDEGEAEAIPGGGKKIKEAAAPILLPHIDARSIATLVIHSKQLVDHKALVERLLDEGGGVGTPPQVDRVASAGSLARPGGPLPYPPPAKAVSAVEAVAALLQQAETEKSRESRQENLRADEISPSSDDEDGGGEGEGQGEKRGDEAGTDTDTVESTLQSLSTLPDFSHDTDNLVAEEHEHLADSHSVLTALALEEEVKIILLLSQQARDRIQGWRMAAQAEDIVDQKVPCWLGCGFMEAVEGVATHVRDLCPFRGKQCVGCRQIFKYVELKKHREKECPKRLVGCPNAYQGCVEMPTFDFLYQHTHLRCAFRKVPCRLNCGGMVAYCKRDDHEQVHCNRRGLQCDLCAEIVPALQFGRHLRDDCAERLVSCTVSCRGKFKAKDLARHEQEECILPCKWGCGRRIGPSEMRSMHEFIGCPRRPVECKFNCRLGGLTAEFLAEHEKYQCPERVQRCPNGCGDRVRRKDMAMHLDSWHGSCPERLVRCPSDYVGWRVYKVSTLCTQVTPAAADCRELVSSGKLGKEEIIADSSDDAPPPPQLLSLVKSRLSSRLKSGQADPDDGFLNGSRQVGIIVKYSRAPFEPGDPQNRPNTRHFDARDQLHIRFPDRHEIFDFWSLRSTTRLILLQKVQGDQVFRAHKATKFTCQWMACTALEHHLAFECARRSVWVAGEHDAPGGTGQRSEFRSSVQLAELRNQLDEFLVAPPTTVTCEFCANDFPPADLTVHQRTACTGVSVRCKLGCGKKLPRGLLDDHATNHCPKRPLTCPVCGDQGMWVDEIDQHIKTECRNRPATCQLGCGTRNLTAATEVHHRMHLCEYRLMECSCGDVMRVMDHSDHMISDCNDKPTLCPQGCGATVGRKFVDFHIEFQCSKKSAFFARQMFCPVGCGARMMKRDIIYHVTYVCKRRLSDCPLGCGQSIQFEKLRVHLFFCPRRPICCEAGMKQCNKLLFKWFYDDGGLGQNRAGLVSQEDDAATQESLPTGLEVEVGVRGLVDYDEYYEDDAPADDYSTIANSFNPDRGQHPPVAFIGGVEMDGEEAATKEGEGSIRGGHAAALVQFRGQRRPVSSRPVTTSSSRPSTAKLLGINPDTLTHKASITVVDSRMFLKPRLRLKACKHHGATALMAACRMNEIQLGIFIVKSTQGMDMEMETTAGETALTLACRLGKLEFVELLLQNGADVNYETSLGKTALIEAVRAPVEKIPVVEFLVAAGATVAYKTKKHGRSAMEWSRLLKLATLVRILELGEVVQRQTTLLFNAIGCGDTSKVQQLIGDGDFFDANNEKTLYDKMESEVAITRQAHVDAAELRASMRNLTTDVETTRTAMQEAQVEYETAKKALDNIFLTQDRLTLALSKLFVTYERIADTLLRSDLEELGRLRKPDVAVRGAVFCYGILMGYLDRQEYSENDLSFERAKKWWPLCAATLRDSAEAMKRIRAFSLDKLMAPIARPLLDRARSMYRDLSFAVAAASREAAELALALRVGTPKSGSKRGRAKSSKVGPVGSDDDGDDDGSKPVAVIPWGKRAATATAASSSVKRTFKSPSLEQAASSERLQLLVFAETDDLKGLRPRTTGRDAQSTAEVAGGKEAKKKRKALRRALRLEREEMLQGGDSDSGSDGIPDADWDSEADEAGGGEWVKGEWVPVVKKKEKWWIREPKKGSKEEALKLQQEAEAEEAKREKEQRRRQVEEKFRVKKVPDPGDSKASVPVTFRDPRSGKALSRGLARALTVDLTTLAAPAILPEEKIIRTTPSPNPAPIEPPQISPPAATRPATSASDGDREAVEEAYRAAMADSSSAHFVRCILVLLKAANQLAEDQATIRTMKEEVVAIGQNFDEHKRKQQAAQVAFMGAQAKRLMTEKNLIDMIRYARFTLKRAKRFREKLRVARLLSKVTTSGHTAISYAASLGNFDAVELLLSHGASPGYNSQLLHLSASFIQLSYRLYRFVTEARREGLDAAQDKFKALKKESKKKMLEAAKSGGAKMGEANVDGEEEEEEEEKKEGGGESSVSSDTVQSQPRKLESIRTDVNVTGEFKAMTSAQAIEKMFAMKEHRTYILGKIRFFRSKMRFPVPEAVYNGRWEMVRRLVERRLFHRNFSHTWVHPCPPPPYIRRFHRLEARPEKLDMLTVLAMGMNDISSGVYVESQGWVAPDDPRDHYGLAQEYLQALTNKLDGERAAWQKERQRIRYLALERIKSRTAVPELVAAIAAQDWRACMYLASHAGVSIDHESSSGGAGGGGVTCLVAAAEEDVGRLNYAPMLNDDGSPCLAVEFLLDRTTYRPAVNLELSDKCAHTALMRAAALGRSAVVASLLDRGADVNLVNRVGKIALHYAAEAGNFDSVRILLERGSDLSILTRDGLSAYDIAEEYGFLNVMKAISRYGNGFLGPVRVARGRVDELTRCPLGCGKDMQSWDVEAHLLVCLLRVVECPLCCGQRLIMAKELAEHVASECLRRRVPCDDCSDPVEVRDMQAHKDDECVHRFVLCNLGCGQSKKVYEMKKHLKFCPWRVVHCQLQCGLELRVCEMSAHVKSACAYRKLPCSLKCGAFVTSKLMGLHIRDTCPLRPSNCRFCLAPLQYREVEVHQRVCHVREEPCPAHCGAMVCITDTKVHMLEQCTHRFVPCPLRCNQKIRLCDTDAHISAICDMRLVPCPLRCITNDWAPVLEQEVSKITARLLELHTTLECPERTVHCLNCKGGVKAKEAKRHKETTCPMRMVPCRNPGCSKELHFGEREEHERKTCKFKLVVCPQGCGELVAAIYTGRHSMLACSWRYSNCPLGCGANMRHKLLQEHMENDCVRRFAGYGRDSPPRAASPQSTPSTSRVSTSPITVERKPGK